MISLKNLIIEGRYDGLVTKLSNMLLAIVKDSYAAVSDPQGEFSGQKIYFKSDEEVPDIDNDDEFKYIYFEEVENTQIPLEFYLQIKIQWIEGLDDLQVGGDAYNDDKADSADLPLIEIRFKLDPAEYPQLLSEVAMSLRDTLRHEIEHITQSGWNLKDKKYLPSDKVLRNKIQSGKLPAVRYFILPKEIDAMIHGLYYRAKKSRQPFANVVNDYLDIWVDNGTLTQQDKETIIQTWKQRLPNLAIRQEL